MSSLYSQLDFSNITTDIATDIRILIFGAVPGVGDCGSNSSRAILEVY